MHPSHDPRRPGYGGPQQGGPGYQPPGYRPTVPSRSGPQRPGPQPAPGRPQPSRPEPSRPEPPRESQRPSRPSRGRAVQIDPVPVEILAGLAWLTVGTLAFSSAGAGTLVLAVALVAGGWIIVENRRRGSQPFDPSRSAELLRLAGGAVAVVIVASILFGLIGWSAFLPGLAAVATGAALVMLSTATGQRATRWLGIAVVVLGLLSAFVSTQTATGFFSQGVVGLVVGLLMFFSAADRVGLLEMLRDRFQ